MARRRKRKSGSQKTICIPCVRGRDGKKHCRKRGKKYCFKVDNRRGPKRRK